MYMTWAEMPRSPGHAFYDKLQTLLTEERVPDGFVQTTCKSITRLGWERRHCRRAAISACTWSGILKGSTAKGASCGAAPNSYSLRDFLRLANRDKVPDHSWLSKTRSRLPHEVHEKVFGWVLALVAERGLVKGERIGVDGSTMEANAALRTIVRRDSGETYREMLTRMAKESGVETPTIDDLVRLDRKRKGKKLSNEDGRARYPDAKIARMKDGSSHLAFKPEHAVDLDTGVVVAAPIHSAEAGDTATLGPTLEETQKNLAAVGLTPTCEDPSDLVADKGYHSRDGLKAFDGGPWKTPHRRKAETRQGLFALAWRRRGARGGVVTAAD